MPVPWGCGFSGAPPTALKRCADHADQIGMGHIDFRIDHRDRDVGAPDHAVNVQDLELLENVLRGVALLTGIAARCRRLVGGRHLFQRVHVVRLRDGHELDGRQRADDVRRRPAVGDAELHRGRSGDGEILRGQQCQSELRDRGLQLFHGDVAGDLQDHFVLDETGLVRGRDVDDASREAGGRLLASAGTRR